MKFYLPLIILLVCVCGFSISQKKYCFTKKKQPVTNSYKKDLYEDVRGMKKAAKYLNSIRQNQHSQSILPKDVLKAQQATIAAVNAKEDVEMEWEFLGPSNVGGRTRTLIIDKNNPNKLYTGGVGGGIFMSEDGGKNWNAYAGNSNLSSPAIVSGCQAANGAIYMGTGEGFFFFSGQGSAGILGTGIYKSTDGGANFELLPATIPSNTNAAMEAWAQVNVLAAHPEQNIIYAGIGNGLRLSEDGGNTWTNPLPTSITHKCWDIAVGTNGTVHAVVGSTYFRANDGLNFEATANNSTDLDSFPPSDGRIAIAVAPSNPDYIYAVAVKASGCLDWVAQSTNGGDSWIIIGYGDSDYLNPLSNSVHCQGNYDLALTVNPLDEEQIYLGGVSLWTWTTDRNWTTLDNIYNYPENLYYLHADKHHLQFAPNDATTFYVLTDGGIYKSNNIQSNTPTFAPINQGLNITQFYSVAAGLNGAVAGGTQDNGTLLIDFESSVLYNGGQLSGGDGGYCEIADINPLALFIAKPNGKLLRSANGGLDFGGYLDEQIDCLPKNNDGSCSSDGYIDGGAEFVTPFLLWENLPLYLDSGIVKTKLITGSASNNGVSPNVWLTEQALNFNILPRWYNIGRFMEHDTHTLVRQCPSYG